MCEILKCVTSCDIGSALWRSCLPLLQKRTTEQGKSPSSKCQREILDMYILEPEGKIFGV
jgi:hypothetical protein